MSVTVQTTYQQYFEQAKAGLIADIRTAVLESFAAENELNFGMATVAGTDPAKQVKKPSAASQVFRGITVAAWTMEQKLTGAPASTADSIGKFVQYDMVPVLRRGLIWVKVVQDVVIDDAAYFVHTEAVNPEYIGYFRKDVDGGNADAVPTGVFRSSALAGALALLEVNIP